jgi:hypothetical protein
MAKLLPLRFRHQLQNRLAEVISDSSNDRNYLVVWLRIEILLTNVAWRPASPSSKGINPPETHQSGSEQLEDVAGGVDVAVPEVGPANTVGTAQDIMFFRNSNSPSSLVISRRAFSSVWWHTEHSLLVLYSSIGTTVARFWWLERNP